MITTWAMVALLGVSADGISLKFLAEGATAKVGGYRPIRAELNEKSDIVKKAPDGLTAPKYGFLQLGDKKWAVIADEPADKPQKLFVDANGDGDLTNDPEVKWSPRKTPDELTQHNGEAAVDLGNDQRGKLGMYRFDPKDPRRAQLKDTILFYTDFGYEVTLVLDGKEHQSFVSGSFTPQTNLWIDRDGNHRPSFRREVVQIGAPFNYTGTTYVIELDGVNPKLTKAEKAIPVMPLPPDLSVGKKAIEFTGAAMDGAKIEFPKTYAGKLVLLDFWATWCGPCIAELPNVKQAYMDHHDQGFEVLGISFDHENMTDKLKEFTKEKEMPWPQIYEGKGWETSYAELYEVEGIPFVLLVDGDTGEILANERQLRGPGLSEFIGKQLELKSKK